MTSDDLHCDRLYGSVHVHVVYLVAAEAIQCDSELIPEALKTENVISIANLCEDIVLRSKRVLELGASLAKSCEDPICLENTQKSLSRLARCPTLKKC